MTSNRMPAVMFAAFALSFFAPLGLAAMQAKSYPVKDFTEFTAGGAAQIEITQDGTEYLRVEAEEEVLNRVKVDQTGERVSVSVKSPKGFFNWFGGGDDHIRVVLKVKTLKRLELSGGAYAKVSDFHGDELTVRNSGAAEVKFATVNAATMRVDLSGAANMHIKSVNSQQQEFDLSGAASVTIKSPSSTQSLQADVSGASNLRAKKLTAKNAKVDASGASHIEIAVTDVLEASASGAASVNYYGNPKAKTDASGASHINAQD